MTKMNRPKPATKKSRPRSIDSVNIYFAMREHGWMNLCLEFSRLKIVIYLSAIFDPIPAFLDWVQNILERKESSVVEIDEEGLFKTLIFEKFRPLDDDLFEFRIISDREGPYHEYEVKKLISRKTFLTKTIEAIQKLANENADVSWASKGAKLSDFLNPRLDKLIEMLNQEFPVSEAE